MAECIRFDYPLPEDDRIHRIWNQISAIRHEVYADELQPVSYTHLTLPTM